MSIRMLTAEMHVVQCGNEAAWALSQAAACPPYAVIRRGCLLWKAWVHYREMAVWEAQLYAEVRAEEFRFVDQDQHA